MSARELLFGGDLPSMFPPPPPIAPPSHAALAISGAADAPLPSREERWAMKQKQRMQQMQQSQQHGQQQQISGVFIVSNQASIPAAPGSLPSALIGGGGGGERGLTLAERLKANATSDPSFASGFSPKIPKIMHEPDYLQSRISQPMLSSQQQQQGVQIQPVPSVPWDAEKAYIQQYLPPHKQQQSQMEQNFPHLDQNNEQWYQPSLQQRGAVVGGTVSNSNSNNAYADMVTSMPVITVGKPVQHLDVENLNKQQNKGANISPFMTSNIGVYNGRENGNGHGFFSGQSVIGGNISNSSVISPVKSNQTSKQSYGDELMKQQEAKERQKEELKRREKEEASTARGILPIQHQNQSNYFSPQRKQQQQQQQQQVDNPVQSKAQLLRAAALNSEPTQAEQGLGLPSSFASNDSAIAAKKSAYGDELQRQAKLREEAKAKEKEQERNEAKKCVGLGAIVAASENHGRGMVPAEKRSEMQQVVGQRVTQQRYINSSSLTPSYMDNDQYIGPKSSNQSDFSSRIVSSRSPLQAEADARNEFRFDPPNGPLGGLSSKQQVQPGHDKELYKIELQQQMQEKESQKMKSKLEALNPLHVPDGREGERQKHRAIVIQAQQQHQQAFLAARVLDEAENRIAQQNYPHPQQVISQPFLPSSNHQYHSFPGPPAPPPFQSMMMMPPEQSPTNINARRHQSTSRSSPVSFNLLSAPQEDIAARKRLEYAADLERQVYDAKMRKEADKRAGEERERRLELEAVEYAKEQALRKARGGNGEPLRDVDGRVLTDVKSVAASNKSFLTGASGGRQPQYTQIQEQQQHIQAPMQTHSVFSGSSTIRDDLFGSGVGPDERLYGASNFSAGQVSSQHPIYGQQVSQPQPYTLDHRQHTVPSSITRPVSPTDQARKARLQMENAHALEQQIEEIRRKKADETARRKQEEAIEEERLSKERQELGEKFKREEKERQQREQEELDKALQAQIEAKNKERADERERERILEERAEAKLRQQHKELQEKYKEQNPSVSEVDSKSLSTNTSPVVQDEFSTMNQRGGVAPVGAAARRLELFGGSSPSTETSVFPPTGSRFIDLTPAQVEPQRTTPPFQQQQQRLAPPPPFFPPPPPPPLSSIPSVDPMESLDPRVQQRISAAEEELERLRNALSELHVQNNDNRFADGLQRLGLTVPGSQQEKELERKAALQRQIEQQRATAQPLTLFPPSAPLPLRTVSFAGLAKAAPASTRSNDQLQQQQPLSSINNLDISLGGSSRLLASSSGLDASLWEPMKDAHISPKAVLNKLESLEPHQHEERGKHIHDLLRSLFPDLNVINADQLTSPQSVVKSPDNINTQSSLVDKSDLFEVNDTNTLLLEKSVQPIKELQLETRNPPEKIDPSPLNDTQDADESLESMRPLGQSFKTLQQQNRDTVGVSSSSRSIKTDDDKVEKSRSHAQTSSEERRQTQMNNNDIEPVTIFQPPVHNDEHNSAEKRKSLVGSFLNHFGESDSPTDASFDAAGTRTHRSSTEQLQSDESFAPPDMLRISKHFKDKEGNLFQENDEEDNLSISTHQKNDNELQKSSGKNRNSHSQIKSSLYSSPSAPDDDMVSAIVEENKRKLEILEKKGSMYFNSGSTLVAPPFSAHATARSSVVNPLRPSVTERPTIRRSEIDGHSKHVPLLEHEGDDYHTPDNLHPSARYKDVVNSTQRQMMTKGNRVIHPLSSSLDNNYDDDDIGLIVDSRKNYQDRSDRNRPNIDGYQHRYEDENEKDELYYSRSRHDDARHHDGSSRRDIEADRRYNSRGAVNGLYNTHETHEQDYSGRGRVFDEYNRVERGVLNTDHGFSRGRGSSRRGPVPVRERERRNDSHYYEYDERDRDRDRDESTSRYYSYRNSAHEEDSYHPTERVPMRRDPRRMMGYEDESQFEVDRRRYPPPPSRQYREFR